MLGTFGKGATTSLLTTTFDAQANKCFYGAVTRDNSEYGLSGRVGK